MSAAPRRVPPEHQLYLHFGRAPDGQGTIVSVRLGPDGEPAVTQFGRRLLGIEEASIALILSSVSGLIAQALTPTPEEDR